MRTFTKFFCVLVAFFALAACSSPAIPDKPEAVAKKYLESIIKGDVESIMKLINLPDKNDPKNAGVEDMARGRVKMMIQGAKKRVEDKGGINSIETEKVEISGSDKSTAWVTVITKFKNGEQEKGTIWLMKNDKGWRVNR